MPSLMRALTVIFMMCRTAKPRDRLMHVLRKLFPGTSDDQFVLLNDITGDGASWRLENSNVVGGLWVPLQPLVQVSF